MDFRLFKTVQKFLVIYIIKRLRHEEIFNVRNVTEKYRCFEQSLK